MQAWVPRILLVEGDAPLRGFLTRVLRECGCAVVAVGSYREGLSQAQMNHFSMCMTDACLPDGSGSDLCQEIHTINTGVPVVICYSHDGQGDAALQAGAQATVKIGDYVTCQLQLVLNQLVEIGMEVERSGAESMMDLSRHAAPALSIAPI